MTDVDVVDEDINFEEMFPKYIYDYNSYIISERLNLAFKYVPVCNEINKKINPNGWKNQLNFTPDCRNLSLFLHHIKNISENEKKARCKYFNYKLKDLITKNKCTCNPVSKCYENMIAEKGAYMTVPNICKTYVDDLPILDGYSFTVFQHLDDLYNVIFHINIDKNKCHFYNNLFYKYITVLRNYTYENKKIHSNLIDKVILEFQKVCSGYVTPPAGFELVKRESENHNTLNHKSVKSESVISTAGNPDRIFIKHENHDALYDSSGTSTGISTGVVIITFLLMSFLLYKYTPYGSLIQMKVKKLMKCLNNENEDDVNLIESFERKYKNSIDESYRIAYTTEDYYE
ncbi:variable surface protein [Plasmodium gonderi]|uniref:Variable surface protein n=1 Tax=Plasmodium gonderi TaxID=77519 RepID=A0A1Y1JTQ7_PLAGO|nr:variable surface protein [Plasmodium gonderi]GAW84142.1 variable surface protein [Plasmodium gonderi]